MEKYILRLHLEWIWMLLFQAYISSVNDGGSLEALEQKDGIVVSFTSRRLIL